MSEQTPRRRRADRAYTPEENEAAPCRRRTNADEPPRRRPLATAAIRSLEWVIVL